MPLIQISIKVISSLVNILSRYVNLFVKRFFFFFSFNRHFCYLLHDETLKINEILSIILSHCLHEFLFSLDIPVYFLRDDAPLVESGRNICSTISILTNLFLTRSRRKRILTTQSLQYSLDFRHSLIMTMTSRSDKA